MKFLVNRDPLTEAVNWVARSLSVRPLQTSLLGIVINVDDEIKFTSSNLETTTEAVINADILEKGRVLVPGRLLADIARSLPDKPITFALDGTKVLVNAGSAKFQLPTLPVEEFPTLPNFPNAAGTIDSNIFAEGVSQVAIAAGKDESLVKLTGVHIEVKGKNIVLAATDRYRLAVKELTWNPGKADIENTILVRARTISELAKSLTGSGKVTFALADGDSKERLYGFKSDDKTLTSRTLDEVLPPFRQLLTTDSAADVTIEVVPFLEAVHRVALVTDKTVPLKLIFSPGNLELQAGSGNDAQASENISVGYSGEEFSTGFNPQFLIDGIQAVDAPFVHVSFTALNKHAIFMGKKEADASPDTSYKYLLMPMRYSS